MKGYISMRILAHRGYWNRQIIPNSQKAIFKALEIGYGFESDIRDFEGRLVISHNIADKNSCNAELVFKELARYKNNYCFAINIKADGLKWLVKEYTEKYNITNYFLFDMSVPQMVEFDEMGLRFFSRQSEYEMEPILYEKAAGVWIDSFHDMSWITEDLLLRHIQNNKEVCIVSPDLHNRNDFIEFWEKLKKFKIDFGKIMLCTDYPDKAKEFFYGK